MVSVSDVNGSTFIPDQQMLYYIFQNICFFFVQKKLENSPASCLGDLEVSQSEPN